jgi:preprotein translocase SecE subunit
MSKTKDYIKEVIAEGKNVHWPTRKQAIFYTAAVLIVSAIIAYYLGLLDFLFGQGLNILLIK